ncbi:hypothetical protein REPUB_Repub02eG0207400 [Reevesia pubescens]
MYTSTLCSSQRKTFACKSFRCHLQHLNAHYAFLVIFIQSFLPFAHLISSSITGFYEGDATPSLESTTPDRVSLRPIGWPVYSKPIHLWNSSTMTFAAADVCTHFSFTSYTRNTDAKDKCLALLLAPVGYQIPSDNSLGAILKLMEKPCIITSKSHYHIIAVEFDVHFRGWEPPTQHVGINNNSLASDGYVPREAGLQSGKLNNFSITYNATTKILSVFRTFYENPVFLDRISFGLNMDLMKFVKDLPKSVANDISASTENYTGWNTIKSWLNLTVSLGTLALVLLVIWLLLKKRKLARNASQNEQANRENGGSSVGRSSLEGEELPRQFSLEELHTATNNFADDRKLGEGGSAHVYKGTLGKELVAVKKMLAESESEFNNELRVIRRLIHRNVVKFIGWCLGENELFIVYEYMPNGSLESHLHENETTLPWDIRYRVATDLVLAIQYLHEGAEKCVIHRDIKPENILLDKYFTAKLGDFGIAKLTSLSTSQTSTGPGTPGYQAPEYLEQPNASKEADMYSFGIVALEIASGRKPDPNEHGAIHKWIWQLHLAGNIADAADGRLQGNFDKDQMKRLLMVGLWCTRLSSKERPNVGEVIKLLQPGAPLPKLPTYMHENPAPSPLSP